MAGAPARIILWASLLALGACHRYNPDLFCDGIEFRCSDHRRCDRLTRSCVPVAPGTPRVCASSAGCPPEFPLCDEEATACRACADGEDGACAARDARTPRCLGGRCVGCVAPEGRSREVGECARRIGAGAAPVCDAAWSECRPCALHGECLSGVCAKDGLSDAVGIPQGSCVPPEQVMVVDPSLCSEAGPVFCTPRQALGHLDPKRRYVVFRKSARAEDFSDIEIGRFETQGLELHLIGPLSDGPPAAAAAYPRVEIGAPGRRGFVVHRRTRVTLEGFLIRDADVGVQCFGDGPGSDTRVRIQRSLIAGSRTALAIHDECVLELEQSWIGRGPGTFRGLAGNELAVDVFRADFSIRNTVFSDNGDVARGIFGGVRVLGGLGGGPEGKRLSSIVNSTFYGHNAWVTVGMDRYTGVVCDSPVGGRLVLLNTLFFQDPKAPLYERYVTPACGGQFYHLGSDDDSLSANQGVVLPRGELPGFQDAAARDLHIGGLSGASPQWRRVQTGGAAAVRVGSQELRAPETDMDGRPRGQGGTVSMGAYEPER